jgi:hypothetical protein
VFVSTDVLVSLVIVGCDKVDRRPVVRKVIGLIAASVELAVEPLVVTTQGVILLVAALVVAAGADCTTGVFSCVCTVGCVDVSVAAVATAGGGTPLTLVLVTGILVLVTTNTGISR